MTHPGQTPGRRNLETGFCLHTCSRENGIARYLCRLFSSPRCSLFETLRVSPPRRPACLAIKYPGDRSPHSTDTRPGSLSVHQLWDSFPDINLFAVYQLFIPILPLPVIPFSSSKPSLTHRPANTNDKHGSLRCLPHSFPGRCYPCAR